LPSFTFPRDQGQSSILFSCCLSVDFYCTFCTKKQTTAFADSSQPQLTRLCPLLNGSRPRDQNPDDTASLGQINAPVAASFVNLD
jgi:hypothetical protein